jgi:hypothetical protein
MLITFLIFTLSCSNKKQVSVNLSETDLISLSENNLALKDIYLNYYTTDNSIFLYNPESQNIRVFKLVNEKILNSEDYAVNYKFDKSQALQYTVQDSLLIVHYPDSLLCLNFYKDTLLNKIIHNGYNTSTQNFPYGLNINFKPKIGNNKIILEGYNKMCEDYPTKCKPYDVLWELNLEKAELTQLPIKFQSVFYDNYIKYQNEISSVWSKDTMFYISSTNNYIEAANLLNNTKYSSYILPKKQSQENKISEDNYMEYIFNEISFGNQFSYLQLNNQNNKLYFTYIPEIEKYDENGLLNYKIDREKYILEYNKNLELTNRFKIPDYFSSKFFVLDEGLILFKIENESITSTFLLPL